jgi:threonine aldolase
LTRPGDEVLLGQDAHMMWHEAGAGAANAGVLFNTIGRGGLFTADEFSAALKPPGHIVLPATGLVAIENTHNLGGGGVFPQTQAVEICAAAHAAGVASYLDGARLFNASVASGISLAELARPFDLVSVALSKGLGCPVGSVLAGSADVISHAVRARRMFGGAMRQSGILAAAGLYALDHHLGQLADDHANARLIAELLAALPGVALDLATVQTNIVVFSLDPGLPDAATIVGLVKEAGVLVSALGPRTIRAVTHRDLSRPDCARAANLLAAVIEQSARSGARS